MLNRRLSSVTSTFPRSLISSRILLWRSKFNMAFPLGNCFENADTALREAGIESSDPSCVPLEHRIQLPRHIRSTSSRCHETRARLQAGPGCNSWHGKRRQEHRLPRPVQLELWALDVPVAATLDGPSA